MSFLYLEVIVLHCRFGELTGFFTWILLWCRMYIFWCVTVCILWQRCCWVGGCHSSSLGVFKMVSDVFTLILGFSLLPIFFIWPFGLLIYLNFVILVQGFLNQVWSYRKKKKSWAKYASLVLDINFCMSMNFN